MVSRTTRLSTSCSHPYPNIFYRAARLTFQCNVVWTFLYMVIHICVSLAFFSNIPTLAVSLIVFSVLRLSVHFLIFLPFVAYLLLVLVTVVVIKSGSLEVASIIGVRAHQSLLVERGHTSLRCQNVFCHLTDISIGTPIPRVHIIHRATLHILVQRRANQLTSTPTTYRWPLGKLLATWPAIRRWPYFTPVAHQGNRDALEPYINTTVLHSGLSVCMCVCIGFCVSHVSFEYSYRAVERSAFGNVAIYRASLHVHAWNDSNRVV